MAAKAGSGPTQPITTPPGRLVTYASKAFYGTLWPYAGVLSSNGGNPQEIAFEVGERWPDDVPALLDTTSAALRRYAAQGYLARVLLATCADRPQLWLVSTDDATGDGAFVPCELLHYLNTGNDLPEAHRAILQGRTSRTSVGRSSADFTPVGRVHALSDTCPLGGEPWGENNSSLLGGRENRPLPALTALAATMRSLTAPWAGKPISGGVTLSRLAPGMEIPTHIDLPTERWHLLLMLQSDEG